MALGCQRFASIPLEPSASARGYLARSLQDPELLRFLRSIGQEPGYWPISVWDFRSLTLAALYFQPALEPLRAQWRVALAAERTAAGRRNPVLTVAPGISANAAAGVSPWFPLASIDVPIETAGKRGLRRTYTSQLAAVSELSVQSAAWQVRSRIRAALVDLSLSERRGDLLERELQLQSSAVEIMQQRLSAGAAAPYEVTLARSARLRLEAEVVDARLRATAARAQLAEAIGLPAQALAAVQLRPIELATAEEMSGLLAEEARDRALQSRSDIRGLLAEYAASETALRLEIARQYPDVHLNPGYQFDQGEHKWSLGLSVELPLFNQNQGPIAEAEAKRREVAGRFLALQAQVIGAIEQAASELKTVQGQQARMAELLNLHRQGREAAESAFKAGNADRLELTTARLEAALAEVTAAELSGRALAAVGRLEDALQVDASAGGADGDTITQNAVPRSNE